MKRMEKTRPEFSRLLPLDRLPRDGIEQLVEAREPERAALARRLFLPAVGRLACRFSLVPETAGRVVAEGRLDALVTQICVVSLEPFDCVVRERFVLHFVPAGRESDDPDPALPDEITFTDGEIDLGEAAAEQLALALDPYPRDPAVVGADPSQVPGLESATEPEAEPSGHAFAALARRRGGAGRA